MDTANIFFALVVKESKANDHLATNITDPNTRLSMLELKGNLLLRKSTHYYGMPLFYKK
jgi:hypothetical protein